MHTRTKAHVVEVLLQGSFSQRSITTRTSSERSNERIVVPIPSRNRKNRRTEGPPRYHRIMPASRGNNHRHRHRPTQLYSWIPDHRPTRLGFVSFHSVPLGTTRLGPIQPKPWVPRSFCFSPSCCSSARAPGVDPGEQQPSPRHSSWCLVSPKWSVFSVSPRRPASVPPVASLARPR